VKPARKVPDGARRPRRIPGWFRFLGWLALLLCALFLVTWRQTRALELETTLRDLETRRALAASERVELDRRIETLRSRARVVRVARERLGMHVAVGDEIVFLPAPAAPVDSVGTAMEVDP
jgi:cell division protein FtsL